MSPTAGYSTRDETDDGVSKLLFGAIDDDDEDNDDDNAVMRETSR